jgi:hypothetical protein
MSNRRRVLCIVSFAVLAASFLAAQATAQEVSLFKFRGTQVPVKLKIKDQVADKGVFDLEFVRTSDAAPYAMKAIKRGKVLDVIQGEEWPYDGDNGNDKDIPIKPTLKMTMNKGAKLLTFIFESGKDAHQYPKVRVRVRVAYEE